MLKLLGLGGDKIKISYPAIFSGEERFTEVRIKLINFGKEFFLPYQKWAVAKAKAFLLDKINEYRKQTGKSVKDFIKEFPPSSEEDLLPLLQGEEVIGVITDTYNDDTWKFSPSTMYDIYAMQEKPMEDEKQFDKFIGLKPGVNVTNIHYLSIYNSSEKAENGEAKIRLVNFDEEFEDLTVQDVYGKTMAFLLDTINEYRRITGKNASDFMKDFPSSTREELLPLLKEGDRIVEFNIEYDEDFEEFDESEMFYIDNTKKHITFNSLYYDS